MEVFHGESGLFSSMVARVSSPCSDTMLKKREVERDSFEFVRHVLADFVGLSGLVANVGKSSMFVVGMESGEAEELAAFMGFSLGSLPVRYLGLPLLVGRLRAEDYAPLIQRIIARIRNWAAWSLFFVGRLQLVRSVLQSFQGSAMSQGGARVAWDEVCLLLGEERLGVKHVASWNQAAIMKLLWLLLIKPGSSLEARLSEFMDGEGGWSWPTVSWELLEIWGLIQAVEPRVIGEDYWVWVPDRRVNFLSLVRGRVCVQGCLGLVFYRRGVVFRVTPSMRG
ncbi:uncharacterized protein LOC120083957 [Benincasa hispida]|uniref:uncharacterized protein LOC120083957 n=1 Tax=Benincasa hispida TaxID=102211 RepID=UPI0018FF539D|nr:uncharacterized protein LOC120083957 [Benincasa hispida]